MNCIKAITEDLFWVGGNNRRAIFFEGVYPVPKGVSYNAYLLMDEQTVLFDTVDSAVSETFFENIAYALGERPLDYIIVQHMEPDHSGTLEALLAKYPAVKVVCNSKTLEMMKQFIGGTVEERVQIVAERSVLKTGQHELTFLMAPMVHWPEVMMTYDQKAHTLFTADAFGHFGALHGAIFADEVNFERDYLDEARRYYCNIVGKYGLQVQAVFKKIKDLSIQRICPLHGFVWRNEIGLLMEKYQLWSTYTPEEEGVMLAYASIYGHTENAAQALASKLWDKGIPVEMFDVSVTHPSEIIAAAFKWSHWVLASPTYNAGIFIKMEDLLHDLVAHQIKNRSVAIIENGSWAPTAGKQIASLLEGCKNITPIGEVLTIKSALKEEQGQVLEVLAEQIKESILKY